MPRGESDIMTILSPEPSIQRRSKGKCCVYRKMVNSFPCEEPEVLEALLRARKFRGSKLRTNVARGAPTERHSSGRVMLKDAVMSDVVKSGHLFNNVRKYHPWVEQLTLNKNLCCTRHTDRNEGTSLIAFFGDFTGGGLFVEEPDGVKHLQGKGIWFEYNGRHPHWTEDFEGERYSIVAYKKPKAKELENKDIIVCLLYTSPSPRDP